MKRSLIASLVAAAALAAAPGAALAQDAGGSQYTDPLDQPGHSNPPPTSSPSPSTPAPSATSPRATASTGTTSSGVPATAQAASTAGAGEIPRTGFPVGMLMFAGALCLSGGMALRRAAGTTGA
jgi:hypothetical protein